MTRLQAINKQEFLQELKNRVLTQQLNKEEIFFALENPNQPETITKFKRVNFSNLTKEDWKQACENLAKDKNYQEEVNLWDSIDDE